MSAFVVSNNHINILINWAVSQTGFKVNVYYQEKTFTIGEDNAQQAGQILLDENYRSVNHRYDSFDKAERFKFVRKHFLNMSKVQIIKHCDCLNYQSCETDDWKDTFAFKIIKAIRERAIHSLPGYDDAKWGE